MDKIIYAFDVVSSFASTAVPYLDELAVGIAIAILLLAWIGAGVNTTARSSRQ
jgi:hypothetical protein